MGKHRNVEKCDKCQELLNEFGTDGNLRSWFEALQRRMNDVHISCAGRGEKDQEQAFKDGKSRAHFSESPHNFTPCLALDLFQITEDGKASFGPEWYKTVIAPECPPGIRWGGTFKKFLDSPHFEINDWKNKAKILIWKKGDT